MRVLVVGAGAVGGHFGALLSRAGADLNFLVRPKRAERLRDDGLTLVDPAGERSVVEVRPITVDEVTGPFDTVLLAVKAPALDAAMDDAARAVGASTAVLPVLNGVDHLRRLQERFGGRVLGGVCFVATQLDADGAVRQLAPGATLRIGELDGSPSKRVQQIAAAFAPAAFDTVVSDAIEQDMWEKWLFMAAGGAACVLLGGAAGRITAVEGGTEAVNAIIDEASLVLDAAGHAAGPEAIARTRNALLAPSSPFTTSMYRDFAAGAHTEVEPVLGDLHRRAAALGVAVPLIAAAATRLRVYESGVGPIRSA